MILSKLSAAFLVGAVLFTNAIAAQTGTVSSFTLENGLQGVVIEDHRAPVVTNMVWYRVGSADEPPGKTGVAHFLEHLMFKGTKTLKPGEFSAIVNENGGVDNAFTSFDYTGYFQKVAADRLPLMMKLEADRMRNLVLSEEDVATERQVVLEERNLRVESDPGALFREQRRAAFYLSHPYSNPIIGWKHEIENLTLENALSFYRTFYAPNNAILVVAGDVTPDQVEALAKEHFGPLKPSNDIPPRIRPKEPPHLAPIRMSFTDPRIRQAAFIRNYLAPKRQSGNQVEAAALVILAELLGGSGISSVMGQKLQLDQKAAIYSTAWYDSVSVDPESFVIYAIPAPDVSLETLEAAIDKLLVDFQVEGVDQAHLKRLKMQIAASDIYALDDSNGIARRYGEALTAGLTIEDVQSWSQVLQSVTEKDIMAAAKKVFDIRQSFTGLQTVMKNEVTK